MKDEWFYFGISLVLLLLHCFTLVFFVALETDAGPFPGRHTARHALNFINLGCSGHEINLLWFHHSVQVFFFLAFVLAYGPIKPHWVWVFLFTLSDSSMFPQVILYRPCFCTFLLRFISKSGYCIVLFVAALFRVFKGALLAAKLAAAGLSARVIYSPIRCWAGMLSPYFLLRFAALKFGAREPGAQLCCLRCSSQQLFSKRTFLWGTGQTLHSHLDARSRQVLKSETAFT